ncbi:MAG: class I SAM-dependent methyltransferase [Candidatus Aenigmarchaeota archaeon]|nr:class I SAM-dependent methyltransferase [Candidatus Aenigmarchaeota archaeon]
MSREFYDKYWKGQEEGRIELRHRLALGLIGEGKSVLEIGCGDGTFSRMLIKKNCRVTGLDISGKAVEKARRRGVNAAVCNVEHELNEMAKGKFDVVVCLDLIEHLFEPRIFLENVKRFIRPGGCMVVTYGNALYWKDRLSILLGRMPDRNMYKMGQHLHYWGYFSFKRFLHDSGFEVREERLNMSPLGNVLPFRNWFVYAGAYRCVPVK